MNKTQITNLVNTNLADSSDITAEEHREVELALVDELYADKIDDVTLSNGNVLAIATGISGLISFSIESIKRGNDITMSGFIKNISNSIIGSNTLLLDIVNIDFSPNDKYIFPSSEDNMISVGLDKIRNVKPLGVDVTLYFNFNYQSV